MTRLILWALSSLLGLGGMQVAKAGALSGSRPNIILILTDDQGMGDLSCMGNPVLKTPHLDQLHARSTRFTDFQVSPTCSPTRGALMSGRHPFEVGITHTILQRERLALDVITFPQALQKAGYKTGLFGKWHLGDDEEYLPRKRGFDEVLMHGAGGIGQDGFGDFKANSENTYFDSVLLHNDTVVKSKGFCTDVFFAAALAWIQQQQEAGKPYFAFIPLNAPHSPMIAPEKYTKRFLDMGYDKKSAGRYGMIENIDDNVGRMVDTLAEEGGLRNTLVIFMTDNGMSMGPITVAGQEKKQSPYNAGLRGGKNSPWEGGTHVPSFWFWEGTLKEGADIPALAAHLDLYRTFCDLAGADIPEGRLPPKGRSLVPLLENPQADWPDRTLFFHRGRWGGLFGKDSSRVDCKYFAAAVRTERWRLVFEGGRSEPGKVNLSDINVDPGEKQNVADQYPEVVKTLTEAYDVWWDSTVPLLVNEGLPRIEPGNFYLQKLYEKQLAESGIPAWEP